MVGRVGYSVFVRTRKPGWKVMQPRIMCKILLQDRFRSDTTTLILSTSRHNTLLILPTVGIAASEKQPELQVLIIGGPRSGVLPNLQGREGRQPSAISSFHRGRQALSCDIQNFINSSEGGSKNRVADIQVHMLHQQLYLHNFALEFALET